MSAAAEKGVEKLTVVSTPERSLAFTNHAYVSPSSTLAPRSRTATENSYVLVQSSTTSHVFIVKAHANVNDGEIAINAIQRGSLKMSQGTSTAKCSPFTIPKEGFAIIKAKMVIDLIGKRHSKVSESALAEFIRDAFVNHVFTKEQEFVLDYMGTPLKLTVQTITVPTTKEVSEKKGDQLTTFGDRGILNSTSMLTIEAIPNKFLEFEADAHAAGGAVTDVFDPDWTFEDMGIGGLDTEFKTIFRRAFASRVFPPAIIQQLGIKHVKGMLLYGPPGTGKTLIARQIARLIDRKGKVPPKVVNGPEVLNKFVGASEEKIRELFADAEADYKARKENADLHIIIFDEIDAICKARGTTGGGTGVHDTVVNQLLTKIDGVDSPNNILVIGMTNRKDMLDPALLRPGRLEVHVEISLPDEQGRVQILSIHTRHMSENGKLAPDVDLPHLASITKNFSGAELEGLVKSAASYALSESIDIGGQEAKTRDSNIMVKQAHFLQAREEMHPAFGVSEDELKEICDLPEAHNGPICYSREYEKLLNTVRTVIKTLQSPDNKSTHLMSLLLEGPHSSGKTATAAYLALESQFPYAKVISPEQYIGYSEASKAAAIFKIFDDAYKSPFSLVILDKIEALIEYTPVGPRFSNTILQALQVLIAKKPIKGRKMLILATSAAPMMISDLQFRSNFDITLKLPALKTAQEVATVFISLNIECEEAPIQLAEEAMSAGVEIPIGKLLQAIDMAKQRASPIQLHHFKDCLAELGLDGDDMMDK